MKKFISVMLLLTMLVTASSCSTKVTEKDKDKVGGDVSDSAEWNSGETSGQVYTSSFGGFKLTAPDENWVFASEEEILEKMDIATDSDILTDSQKRAAEIGKQKTIYDAVLTDLTSGSNVIIMYENLSLTLGASKIDASQYANTLKTQLEATGQYTVDAPQTISFLNESYVRVDSTATIEGVTLSQTYLLKKIDKYMLAICITPGITSGITVDSMMAMFSNI